MSNWTKEKLALVYEVFTNKPLQEKCADLKNLLAYKADLAREYLAVNQLLKTLDPDNEFLPKEQDNAKPEDA